MELLPCSATVPGGAGQWNSCNARAHQLRGRGAPPRRRLPPKKRESCNALLHCLGAVGSATPVMHRLTACRQWAVKLLSCTTALPWGQWAVQLSECTATLPRSSGRRNSYNARLTKLGGRGVPRRRRPLREEGSSRNALPHCLGAIGSATPAMHRHTASGRWAVEFLQSAGPAAVYCRSCTAHCPKGGRRCIARVVLPTAPKYRDSASKEFHCPFPLGSEAVHDRISNGLCP